MTQLRMKQEIIERLFMKPSEILREAAEMVDYDEFCFGCNAIYFSGDGLGNPDAMEYFLLIEPIDNIWATWWPKFDKARVLGILFAAAIAEYEGN